MSMQIQPSTRRQLLLGIFVISGFTGLIYESIWTHYLKLFLGHAAYAQSLVLVIFMGGMALGSWLLARYSHHVRRLLWGYVIVEGVIGIFGLAFHRGFVAITDASFASVIPALSSTALIHAYKWSLAALLILPQSTLLGMTFPLISGGIIRRWPDRPGETLSMLYFTNCLGAALGVLVSGFLLIRVVGLPGAILTAGLMNVALALLVWMLVRNQAEPVPERPAAPAQTGRAQSWFMIAALLTGAASFLYEIGWIRMLSLVLGSSSHSFELMLAAFIFGLACGGLWIRGRIERVRDPVRHLGLVMMLMGALALLTLPAYNWTFDFMAWAIGTFQPTEGGYTAFNLAAQAIALLIMLPATFCAGTALPILTHALLRSGHGERAIGSVYAVNTLGAIVGTLVAIHLLMPLVGVKGVIISGGMIHMALGLSGLALAQTVRRVPRLAFAACCAGVLAIAIFGVSLDPLRMTSSVYRTGQAAQPAQSRVLYLRDGKTATVSLLESDNVIAIATNGKPDAAIRMGPGTPASDEITMVLAAALPLSMHPNPQRVANIGFGSGLTSSTVLLSERVKTLDTVEIEPLMVEAARQAYFPRIRRVFEDGRSRIVFEDAKTFFAAHRQPYDLIISEPSNPWVSGVATLFSDEFYERVAGYLKADGYLVQWLQIYETDISIVASILKAMAPHFGSYALYNADDSNILIVATRGTSLPEPTAALIGDGPLRTELAYVGIDSVLDIRRRRIGDERTIGPLVASHPAPANSDYFPFVDLNAPRLRFMRRNAIELPSLLAAPVPVIDLLAADALPVAPTRPPAGNFLYADALLRQALAVRDALVSGQLEGLDPGLVTQLVALSAPREQCGNTSVQYSWQSAARVIADSTTPYLNAVDVEKMWQRIQASPCYREVPGPHKAWADLLAAVARRDRPGIVATGTLLLQQQQRPASDERDYLVTAVAAAQIHLGNIAQARVLLETNWNSLQHASSLQLSLRQLLAIAQSTRPQALAEQKAGT